MAGPCLAVCTTSSQAVVHHQYHLDTVTLVNYELQG